MILCFQDDSDTEDEEPILTDPDNEETVAYSQWPDSQLPNEPPNTQSIEAMDYCTDDEVPDEQLTQLESAYFLSTDDEDTYN